MNQFTKAELEGRALFKEILDQKGVTESHPSDDEFDTLDYYYTSSQQLSVGVEIKKRDQKYLNYPTHFLEVKKFKAIYQRLNNGEFDRALYVNFFGVFGKVIYLCSIFNEKLIKGNNKGGQLFRAICHNIYSIWLYVVQHIIAVLPLQLYTVCPINLISSF